MTNIKRNTAPSAQQVMNNKHWTAAFYLILGIAALFLVAQPFSSTVKSLRLKQFHLRQDSFAQFALIHFAPPMYSFANEIWYSDTRGSFEEIESGSAGTETFHQWVNHYPTRILSFSIFGRKKFFDASRPHYLYIRSRYRGTTLRTVYELQVRNSALFMKAVEATEVS